MVAAAAVGEEGADVAGAQGSKLRQRQRAAQMLFQEGDVAEAGGAIGLDGAGAGAPFVREVLQERDQRAARTEILGLAQGSGQRSAVRSTTRARKSISS